MKEITWQVFHSKCVWYFILVQLASDNRLISQNVNGGMASCGQGWTYFEPTNKCYRVVLKPLNWEEGIQECATMNSSLASIHSRVHNQFLINMTLLQRSKNDPGMYAFWTGFHVVESSKKIVNFMVTHWDTWQWLDNSPIDYLNWANAWDGRSEPDYYDLVPTTNLSCAVLLADYHGVDGYLNAIRTQWFDDANCNSIYSGAICQQDSGIVLNNNNKDMEDQALQCSEGWMRFELTNVLNQSYNMCYKYIYKGKQTMDYFDAEDECKSVNSSIVYIENEDELDFLLTLPHASDVNALSTFSLYVGVQPNTNGSGNWYWQDNTPADYLKWARSINTFTGEPNKRIWNSLSCVYLVVGGKEYYAAYYMRHLHSGNCDQQLEGTICKKRADQPALQISSTTISTTTILKLDVPTTSPQVAETYKNFTCYINQENVPFQFVQSSFCNPGWAYFEQTNKCYRVIPKNMDQVTAVKTCNELNATLASIHGRAHNDFLIKLAQSLPVSNQTFDAFWIGLVQLNRSHEWTFGWSWIDGSVVDFLGWARLMPKARGFLSSTDNYTYNDDPGCAILVANATQDGVYRINGAWYLMDLTSFWVDVDLIQNSCNSIFSGSICQQDSSFVRSINEKNEQDLLCEDGWTRYELRNLHNEKYNMCYYTIYNSNKMDWFGASDACASINASLATIENQEEHEFLIRDLIQTSNTLPVYSFWLERITDNCGYQMPDWMDIDGPAGFGPPDFIGPYASCCDATQRWAGQVSSEYFLWGVAEPLFFYGRECTVLAVDGEVEFCILRYHKMFVNFCDYPDYGAVCKKKPSIVPSTKVEENKTIANFTMPPSSDDYSPTYRSTLSPDACFNPPPNTASMLVAADTRHYKLDRTKDPIGICPCTGGNRMYWASSNESFPVAAYQNSKLALMLYDLEIMFGEDGLVDEVDQSANFTDHNDYCPSLCICDVDGYCYRPYRYNTEVLFVPYCDESGCFVYAAVSKGKLCRGCDRTHIDDCWGCVPNLDTTKDHIGTNTSYIKVDRVGCRDCIYLINLKCPAPDFSNILYPGWPSLVTFAPTQTNLTSVSRPNSKYLHWEFAENAKSENFTWVPYIMHPRILNAIFPSDAFKDIIYECTFFYGFQINDTGILSTKFNSSYLLIQAKRNGFFNVSDKLPSIIEHGITDINWDAFKDALHIDLFNSVWKSRLERQIEYALRTGNFTNLGENCTSKNYDRYRQINPGKHEKLVLGIIAFDTLREVNIGLEILFGTIGLLFALFISYTILKAKVLQTSFGMLCLVESMNDIILFIIMIFFESFMSIRSFITNGQEDGDLNDIDFGITADLGWRWEFLFYYVFYSAKFIPPILTFLRSFNRFVAVHFSIYYFQHDLFNVKFIKRCCAIVWLLMFCISLPLVLPLKFFEGCKFVFSRSQYIPLDTCAQTYWWTQAYSEYVIVWICFLLNMATMINMILKRKSSNNVKHESKEVAAHHRLQERLFLIQNFGNLATFVILFIPHMVYALGCTYNRWHCIMGSENELVTLIYQISILLFLHNSRVAIWRCFDELISLLCQYRIWRSQHLVAQENIILSEFAIRLIATIFILEENYKMMKSLLIPPLKWYYV